MIRIDNQMKIYIALIIDMRWLNIEIIKDIMKDKYSALIEKFNEFPLIGEKIYTKNYERFAEEIRILIYIDQKYIWRIYIFNQKSENENRIFNKCILEKWISRFSRRVYAKIISMKIRRLLRYILRWTNWMKSSKYQNQIIIRDLMIILYPL